MKFNIYLNEHNIDNRINSPFKSPILQKKDILNNKYKDTYKKYQTHLLYDIPHNYNKMDQLNKNLLNYQSLITISQLKNKNINSLNDIIYNIKINLNLNEKYINEWTENKLNDNKYNNKLKKNLQKNKLLDPEYIHYLLFYKKLKSINIFYSPLKNILLNKYLISRILFIKNLTKLNILKNISKTEWNKLSKNSKFIIYLKLKNIALLKFNHVTYKKIIFNYKNINNKFLKLNLIKLLRNTKENINNYDNISYIYKYKKLKQQKLILNKILAYKSTLNKMLKLVDLLIQKKKNFFLFIKLKKYWEIAYENYKKEEKKILAKKIELFEIKNDVLLFPAKELYDIRSNKEDIQSFLSRFKDINNTKNNEINLENSYLNIIKDPIELSNKYINNNSNRLNLNFNPLLETYKQKQSNLINYNNNLNNEDNKINSIISSKSKNNKLLPENKVKMGYMLHKMINKYKKFDSEISVINETSPLNIIYYNTKNNKPIISQYIKSMSIYNKINKGTIIKYNKYIGYKFNSDNYILVKNIYKYIYYIFKGMFSLISRPVYIFKENRITIRFFYYILLNKFFKIKKFTKNSFVVPEKKYSRKIKNQNIILNNIKIKYKKAINYYKFILLKLISLNKFLIFLKTIVTNENINSKLKNQLLIYIKLIKKKIKLYKLFKFNWESYLNWNLLKTKTHTINFYKNNRKIRKFIYETRKLKKNRSIFYNLAFFPITSVYYKKFKSLTNILSNYLFKNVELELTRLHYPYKNSNILANYLALLINKIKFLRLTRKLLKYSIIKKKNNFTLLNIDNIIPSYLTGLKIKIGGRLMKYRVIRRKTVKLFERGISAPGKVNFTDWARYTSKNRRGAFSITVSTGQNIF